ncbi:MAG TPA: wax ester/triacylglycerol synthase family O-acyltransferase [Kofleriaceae bacterium]|nr:wax ester/triacylglycerol synthase family O-acyltransferase [Kofleriaceae bacterium]
MLKPLSLQDASYLYFETAETPAHVGSVSLVDLPWGYRGEFFADYKATIASRISLIPFLHEKLVQLPFDLERPFWVEDEHIDLDHHIRRVSVPRPGTMRQLEALVAQLHEHPLDRDRPLWEFYVIEGLQSGQLALYTKVHHAAMDGAASQILISAMYDPSPAPRTLPRVPADHRGGLANLARGVLAQQVRRAIRAMQFWPELASVLARVVLPDPKTLRFRRIPPMPRATWTQLNVGITRQRVYAARTLPLAAISQLAKLTDTKVNDVILAICSGALRGYLRDKQALPARPLVAMVPILARDPADQSANQNSLLLCSLASNLADPYERLLAIHRSTEEQKQRFELFKDLPIPDVNVPGTSAIVRGLARLYGRTGLAGHPPVLGNLTISNIPGPTTPLYIAGAKIASMYPCSIPYHGQAVNITVESYCDRLDFGLVACRRAVPDVAHLADRLASSLTELTEAVGRHAPSAPARPVELAAAPAASAASAVPPAPRTPAMPEIPAAGTGSAASAQPVVAEAPTAFPITANGKSAALTNGKSRVNGVRS